MPISIDRKKELVVTNQIAERVYGYKIKHYCPVCKAIHHWQAMSCRRKGCGYVGKLAVLNEKRKK